MPDLKCPFCQTALNLTSPYPRDFQYRREIVIECTKLDKHKVRMLAFADEIKSVVEPGQRAPMSGDLVYQGGWRRDVGELLAEAVQSSYLFSYRGAAISLRMALTMVLNIKYCNKRPDRPTSFDSLKTAISASRFPVGSNERTEMDYIKDLGDTAAHKQSTRRTMLVGKGEVDLAIRYMEDLIRVVHVL